MCVGGGEAEGTDDAPDVPGGLMGEITGGGTVVRDQAGALAGEKQARHVAGEGLD